MTVHAIIVVPILHGSRLPAHISTLGVASIALAKIEMAYVVVGCVVMVFCLHISAHMPKRMPQHAKVNQPKGTSALCGSIALSPVSPCLSALYRHRRRHGLSHVYIDVSVPKTKQKNAAQSQRVSIHMFVRMSISMSILMSIHMSVRMSIRSSGVHHGRRVHDQLPVRDDPLHLRKHGPQDQSVPL